MGIPAIKDIVAVGLPGPMELLLLLAFAVVLGGISVGVVAIVLAARRRRGPPGR